MNKLIILTLLACVALPVQASPELATKSKCMACHQVDKKVLGPSFKDIAAKYKGQKDAETLLTDSQLKGSKGKWGAIPMPAQRIPPADAQALAKWMLTL